MGLRAFRDIYPKGRNFLVTPTGGQALARNVGGMEVLVVGLAELAEALS